MFSFRQVSTEEHKTKNQYLKCCMIFLLSVHSLRSRSSPLAFGISYPVWAMRYGYILQIYGRTIHHVGFLLLPEKIFFFFLHMFFPPFSLKETRIFALCLSLVNCEIAHEKSMRNNFHCVLCVYCLKAVHPFGAYFLCGQRNFRIVAYLFVKSHFTPIPKISRPLKMRKNTCAAVTAWASRFFFVVDFCHSIETSLRLDVNSPGGQWTFRYSSICM